MMTLKPMDIDNSTRTEDGTATAADAPDDGGTLTQTKGVIRMTAAKLARYIGRTAHLPVKHDCEMKVRIVDARTRFGIVDVLVEPVAGTGAMWVEVTSLVQKEANP